jgi:histidinol dehydrogenase
LSPDLPEALEKAGRVRAEIAPNAGLVLITNGTGLLDGGVFSLLCDAANACVKRRNRRLCPTDSYPLNIWLKLDAGTPGWYHKINRSEIPFEKLIAKIKEFASRAPVTVQTMLCAVDGEGPPPEETRAWERLVIELCEIAAGNGAAKGAAGIRKVQIYGKARPAPEGFKTSALPVQYLEERAASLRSALAPAFSAAKGVSPEVTVFP